MVTFRVNIWRKGSVVVALGGGAEVVGEEFCGGSSGSRAWSCSSTDA